MQPSVVARTSTNSALIVRNGQLQLERSEWPQLRDDEVAVNVSCVGLCRTDLYAIAGQIPTKQDLIPGHEFSGVVRDVGSEVSGILPGQLVAVNPLRSCGYCHQCSDGMEHQCQGYRFMGVDIDGACRQRVHVPARDVYVVPEDTKPEVAAFAEPVAAVMATFKAAISPEDRGLIAGDNRIAQLTHRILQAEGFLESQMVPLCGLADLPDSDFDYVIETGLTSVRFSELLRLVRPQGTIVLKSRQHVAFEVTPIQLISKEPVIDVVHYGPFREAVDLLTSGRLLVDDLIGERFPIARYADAFDHAQRWETKKTFLTIGG